MGHCSCSLSCFAQNHIDKDVHLSQMSAIFEDEKNHGSGIHKGSVSLRSYSNVQSIVRGSSKKKLIEQEQIATSPGLETNGEKENDITYNYKDARTADRTYIRESLIHHREKINVHELLRHMNKLDRARIQINTEQKMLESLNADGFTLRVIKSSECNILSNFNNINELLEINQDLDMIKQQVNLINYESAEFYRHVLVSYNGKPVATGCLNITQAPILLRKTTEEDCDHETEENCLM